MSANIQSEAEYYQNITQPAGKTFLPKDLKENKITEIIPGLAWVFPNALTVAECEDWIGRGESAGLLESSKTIRTSSRTSHYNDASMSAQIQTRMIPELISKIETSDPGTKIVGIHENWKIAKYEKGQTFPAHFDQDSFTILPPDEKGRKVSSSLCYIKIF